MNRSSVKQERTDDETTNASSVADSSTIQKRKRKSEAWNHFDEIYENGVVVRGKCRYCQVEIAAHAVKNGTSGLKRHISACPKFPRNIETNQAQLSVQSLNEGCVVSSWKFDQKICRKAIAEMIVIDELPFKFVEREGFKRLMAVACPKLHIPSRFTVARDILGLFQSEREKLKNLLKNSCQRVCLTTDTWTSIQKINYMCLTAQFIDENWKLQKRIINFIPISSHKGEAISLAIEKCLREWETNRVFTITVDNASSNDTAIVNFKRKMANWDSSILQGEYVHMRCVAHILNLIVVDGLKDIDESVMRVRNAIRYVRQSPARIKKFKEYVELEKIECKNSLCLDVPTRWNSTYLMLNVAQKFERAFDRFDDEDPCFKIDLEYSKWVKKIDIDGKVIYGVDGKAEKKLVFVDGRPTSKDWGDCRRYATLLEHFFNLTLKVSGSLYVTSNVFFHEIVKLQFLLRKWQKSGEKDLVAMGEKMKRKFDKYWGDPQKMNKLFFVAVMLDPRYKLEFVEFLLKEVYGDEIGPIMASKVKDLLHALFIDYKGKLEPQIEIVEKMSSVQTQTHVDEVGMGQELWEEVMSRFKKKKSQSGSLGDQNSFELEKYLKEDCEVDKSCFSILDWWKQNSNSHRFPILSQVARDVLAIPISTVASESAFSTGGRVLDSFRSSLTPKMVESLICTQDWLRSSAKYIDDEEDLDDIEILENDLLKMSLDASSSTPIEL